MAVPPTSARRSGWLLAVLGAAALHMLVFDRGLGGDGWAGFSVLTSLFDDHDLWLENNHRGQLNGLIANSAGHLVSQYPPGGPLLDALPFAAGRVLDALLPARLDAGVDLPPLGRVPRGVFLSAAAIVLARNAAVLLGLLWIAFALRRLGCGPRAAAAGAALAFFGGPLLFYSLVGMTHAPAFALAALLFLLLARLHSSGAAELPHSPAAAKVGGKGIEKGRLPALPAWTAGLALGAAVLVRYDAIALLPAALLALRGSARHRRPLPSTLAPRGSGPDRLPAFPVLHGLARRRSLSFALGLVLPLLALPPWWRACFGSWLPPPYGGRIEISFASPWNVLCSPVHGLCWFHPALLLAVAGLALGPVALGSGAARAGWRWVALLWFVSVATIHGWWSEWANLGGYGQRFLCDALPVLALGFAWRVGGTADGTAGRAAHAKRAAALFLVVALAATAFGYGLFFAAVGGLVAPPQPYPWPLRVSDYAPLLHHPPGPQEVGRALCRASFTVRLIARGCR